MRKLLFTLVLALLSTSATAGSPPISPPFGGSPLSPTAAGGSAPGGASGQVQYNNAGALGGTAFLTIGTNLLTVGTNLTTSSWVGIGTSAAVSPLQVVGTMTSTGLTATSFTSAGIVQNTAAGVLHSTAITGDATIGTTGILTTTGIQGVAVTAPIGTGGPVLQQYSVVPKTSTYAVLLADSGKWFTTTGATASVTFNLPALTAAGAFYCFLADVAFPLVVDANTGQTIRNVTSVTASSGNLTSDSTKGPNLCVIAATTTEWIVTRIAGTWTVN